MAIDGSIDKIACEVLCKAEMFDSSVEAPPLEQQIEGKMFLKGAFSTKDSDSGLCDGIIYGNPLIPFHINVKLYGDRVGAGGGGWLRPHTYNHAITGTNAYTEQKHRPTDASIFDT